MTQRISATIPYTQLPCWSLASTFSNQ